MTCRCLHGQEKTSLQLLASYNFAENCTPWRSWFATLYSPIQRFTYATLDPCNASVAHPRNNSLLNEGWPYNYGCVCFILAFSPGPRVLAYSKTLPYRCLDPNWIPLFESPCATGGGSSETPDSYNNLRTKAPSKTTLLYCRSNISCTRDPTSRSIEDSMNSQISGDCVPLARLASAAPQSRKWRPHT